MSLDPPVKRLCHNRLCHREEAESRRGDLVISSAYTGLLRRFASRNDEKSHCDTASKPEDDILAVTLCEGEFEYK